MNQQRPSLSYRLRLYAHQNPQRYAVRSGVFGGIFFGCFTALFFAFFLLVVGSSALWALLIGGLSGIVFGLVMGVFARRMIPEELLPDVSNARLRAAGRLVRSGVPGADPEINQIARHQAKAVLRAPYWPKTMVALFGLGFALNLGVAFTDPGPLTWARVVNLAVPALALFVLAPLIVRNRRRARAFLAALEEDPGPRPDA
ncbi:MULTISPECIES: hypothetical protein [Nocardiopsis]|uniref:hypothetical protein n=1 Tax=Nocardiopsis TaxID=2013 RepID=UPI0008FC6E9C|nr:MULTISPECIES: hypothetical protein [Nocardiopsis]APC38041.1 hypothetical protein A9R04_26710 [Nocardiopsis dassonvillei]